MFKDLKLFQRRSTVGDMSPIINSPAKSPLNKSPCFTLDLFSMYKEEECAKKFVQECIIILESEDFEVAVMFMNNKNLTVQKVKDKKLELIISMKKFLETEQLYIITDNFITTIKSDTIWESGNGIFVGRGDSYSNDKNKFNILF
jgi:hypothetical protein